MSLQAQLSALLGDIELKVSNQSGLIPDSTDENSAASVTSETLNVCSDAETRSGKTDIACELDPMRIKTRQKQIDIGKNTNEYKNFIKIYPRYSSRFQF